MSGKSTRFRAPRATSPAVTRIMLANRGDSLDPERLLRSHLHRMGSGSARTTAQLLRSVVLPTLSFRASAFAFLWMAAFGMAARFISHVPRAIAIGGRKRSLPLRREIGSKQLNYVRPVGASYVFGNMR